MEKLIVVMLFILICLAVLLVVRQNGTERAGDVDSRLKNILLEFRGHIQTSVDNTRKEMTEAREDINRRTRETLQLMGDMNSTVQKIIHQQEEANRLGQSLKDILQVPKIRGNYGEVILEELLEKVLPKGMWLRQHRLGEGAIVDIVVSYRDIMIPIDAKFPRENYIKYLDCEDARGKEECWKQFEKDVILRIREISRYVAPDKGTCDFALMFIPSEAVYYETVAEKNYLGHKSKILEEAEKHKIMPVSPNTFYAFLQVIMSGIRNLEVLSQARSIQEKLAKLETKFTHFYKQYESVGREIEKAADAFRKGDRHIGYFKRELEDIIRIEGDENAGPLLDRSGGGQ